MSNIEQMLQAMTAPPDPAIEVLSLERSTVESILTELEEKDPLRTVVVYLRQRLSEPKVELWAIHSVGPGEVYPCLNREDAERQAQELRDLGHKMKAERIARGESVEMWTDWVTDVIPSPWEPDEHFETMAEEWQDSYRGLSKDYTKLRENHDALLQSLTNLVGLAELGAARLDKYTSAIADARAAIAMANAATIQS